MFPVKFLIAQRLDGDRQIVSTAMEKVNAAAYASRIICVYAAMMCSQCLYVSHHMCVYSHMSRIICVYAA